MRPRQQLVRYVSVLSLVTAFLWAAAPVNAASYRQQNWPTAVGTATVRVIWDSATVDADMIYFWRDLSYPREEDCRIGLLRGPSGNPDYYRYDTLAFNSDAPVCPFGTPFGNVSGIQRYQTQVFTNQENFEGPFYSPEIFV